MRRPLLPRVTRLSTAVAALVLVLTGTACSGDTGRDEASAGTEESQATRTATTEGADAAPARLATAEFRVDGMTCGGCALATEMSVEKREGVASADAEYDEEADEGRCTVEYDPSAVGTDEIAAAIEEAGFTPTLASAAPEEDRR